MTLEMWKKAWPWLWKTTIVLFVFFAAHEAWARVFPEGGRKNDSTNPTSHSAPTALPPAPKKRVDAKNSTRRYKLEQLEFAPPADKLCTFWGEWKQEGNTVTFGHSYTFQLPGQKPQLRKIQMVFDINTGIGHWEIQKPWRNERGRLVMGETSVDEWIGVRYVGEGTDQPDEKFKVSLDWP